MGTIGGLMNVLLVNKIYMKNLRKFYNFNEDNSEVPPHQKEMYDGIVEILLMVKDERNRMDIANKMIKKFNDEDIIFDKIKFIKDCKLQKYYYE